MTLLFGAGFGVLVVALNHAESAPVRAVSLVTGGGAGWAAVGILVAAWWRRRLALSVGAAFVALAAAVTTYYLADAVAAGSPLVDDAEALRFWAMGALVVALPLGLIGWRARRDGTWLGLAAMAAIPLGFAAESALYLRGLEWMPPLEVGTRVGIIGTALAAVVVLVHRKLSARDSRAETRVS